MTKLCRLPKHKLFATRLFAILIVLLSLMTSASPRAQLPSTPAEWQSSWARVLLDHVDPAGRVDFRGLARDRADLEVVITFIGRNNPASAPVLFPSTVSKLAYYLDAYNALAMYGVLEVGVPKRLGWLARAQFFDRRKFLVGGRSVSLSELENNVIRAMGDPRVHFALNCMSVSCPRLPRSPFTAGDLDQELDAAAREFMGDDRNVHVDEVKRDVRLSAIFEFYTKDFLAKAPTLIAYVNRYRTVPVPPEFRVKFAEYDWRINDQARLTDKTP